jgi:hypothetical protein
LPATDDTPEGQSGAGIAQVLGADFKDNAIEPSMPEREDVRLTGHAGDPNLQRAPMRLQQYAYRQRPPGAATSRSARRYPRRLHADDHAASDRLSGGRAVR